MAITKDEQPITSVAHVDAKFEEWWHMMCVAETNPLDKDLVHAAFWGGVMLAAGGLDHTIQQYKNRHNPEVDNPQTN